MFGKLFPCKECNAGAIAGATGLNPLEREIRFADIETDGRPGAAKMLDAARAFVNGGCRGFLTIHGDYGNGKSTMLKAIVNEAVAKGVSARYITMTEVMAYAREAFQSQKAGDTDYGRITDLAKVHVLAIDEVDKARVSDYAYEVQSHLFDFRYRNAYEVGTILAWNGDFKQVELPSVLSRLTQYPVIHNTDTDMRPLLAE